MRRRTGILAVNVGPLRAEEAADVPDFFTATWHGADAGNSACASALASLELSHDVPFPRAARGEVAKDLGLGVGGAFLIHVLTAATVLFMPFFTPPVDYREPVVTVFLAGADNAGDGSGDAAFVDAAPSDASGSGKTPEEPQPREKEFTPAPPVPPQPVTQPPSPPVERKRAPVRAEKRRAPHPATLPANRREKDSTAGEGVAGDAVADPAAGPGAETGGGKEAGAPAGAVRHGGLPQAGITGEFDAAKVDAPPRVLKKTEPVYPDRARSMGICGKVVVRFLVEPDGRVSKPSIVEARPAGYFEKSALDAVCQWRFRPGCLRGHAVSTWVTLPVQFRLIGED